MDDNSRIITRELKRMARISDPDELERIAQRTPYEQIRKTALAKASVMRAAIRDADRSDKCPKCGAPLVNVEYYSAFKGQGKTTKVEIDWSAMKKTTTISTPYSNFHLHTAIFCPACAGRKIQRIHRSGIAMMLVGVLGVILALIALAGRMAVTPRYLIAGGCALLVFIGYHFVTEMARYVPTGEGTITNARLAASEGMHDEISARYVRMTPFKNIVRAEGTNAVVGRGFVRNKQ